MAQTKVKCVSLAHSPAVKIELKAPCTMKSRYYISPEIMINNITRACFSLINANGVFTIFSIILWPYLTKGMITSC